MQPYNEVEFIQCLHTCVEQTYTVATTEYVQQLQSDRKYSSYFNEYVHYMGEDPAA